MLRTEPESSHDEDITAAFLSLLVCPGARTNPCSDDKLISFASMRGDAIGDFVEGQEPDAIGDLTCMTNLLVWLCMVGTNQTEPHIGHVALCSDLGISREVSDSDESEAVHFRSPFLGGTANDLLVVR